MTAAIGRLRARLSNPGGFDRRLVPPMILGSILNPINSSIIAVALIPISRDLHAHTGATVWLVTALYLTTAVGQPLVGRLVDTYGPRGPYLVGTALVGVAGVLGTVAPSIGVLIGVRVLLGLGTCAGYPASMTLIRNEAKRTGQGSPAGILTLLAIFTQTIAVLGPPLGGALVGLGGWRATMAINVPLALACLVLGARRLPRTHASASDGRSLAARLDLAGTGMFVVALVGLLLFLTALRPDVWWLLAVGVLAAAVFVWRELRARTPFIDLRVLAGNLPLVATYGRSLLAAVVSYAYLYGYTQWLEDGRALVPAVAGLILLPTFAVGIVVSSLTGRRPEVRAKLLVGGVVQLVVVLLMLALGAGSPVLLLIGLAALFGIPQGLNSLANQNALYGQADPARMGSSAGLLRTFFYLGAIIASAANSVVFRDGASTVSLHDLAVLLVVIDIALVVLTLVDRSLSRVGREATTSTDH